MFGLCIGILYWPKPLSNLIFVGKRFRGGTDVFTGNRIPYRGITSGDPQVT